MSKSEFQTKSKLTMLKYNICMHLFYLYALWDSGKSNPDEITFPSKLIMQALHLHSPSLLDGFKVGLRLRSHTLNIRYQQRYANPDKNNRSSNVRPKIIAKSPIDFEKAPWSCSASWEFCDDCGKVYMIIIWVKVKFH